MATLSTLPLELHLLWIPFLDPIGLISLAQTNRKFRSLIKPQRQHFVQRLLALELLPEPGGVIPSVRIRDQALTPSWEDTETWESIRFACTGCLRLLSYRHFGTGSYVRLKFQKPHAGCQAAIDSQSTDWSGESLKSQWLRKQKFLEREKNREKSLTALYNRATTQQWDRRIWPSFEHAYEAGEDIALQLCGTKRHRRLCNECRYQRRDFARQYPRPPTRSNKGSKETPVTQGAVRRFNTYVERYFPGLFDYVDEAGNPLDHPHRQKIARPSGPRPQDHIWMTRCSGCAVWQDLAAFRFTQKIVYQCSYIHSRAGWNWPGFPRNDPRCNTCVARASGHDVLAQEMHGFWDEVTRREMCSATDDLIYGWNVLAGLLNDPHCKGHHNGIEAILKGITWKVKQLLQLWLHATKPEVDLDRSDLEDLRLRIRQCRDWIQEPWRDVERPRVLDDLRFTDWLKDYEKYEAFRMWLKRIRRKVDENPMMLVQYALDDNPYARL